MKVFMFNDLRSDDKWLVSLTCNHLVIFTSFEINALD